MATLKRPRPLPSNTVFASVFMTSSFSYNRMLMKNGTQAAEWYHFVKPLMRVSKSRYEFLAFVAAVAVLL